MTFLRSSALLVVFFIASAFVSGRLSFEESQKNNERVREVFERKDDLMRMRCRMMDVPEETFGNIFIRAFKEEEIFEVWVQKADGKYIKFKEFKIYAHSGELGPKCKRGDCQVPEGYYHVRDFNPQSNYYLSLGVSYPNDADKALYPFPDKGSDIYIHGATASAGCLAMSNYYIEDIYMCAVKARNNGQQTIPIQIFPFKLTQANIAAHSKVHLYKPYSKFWNNLAEGYNFFEKTNRLPEVSISSDGTYRFSDGGRSQASDK